MKKRNFRQFLMMIGIIIILCLTIPHCKEEVQCGSLTIKDLPEVPAENFMGSQVKWTGGVYFDEDIQTQLQLSNWEQSNCVATFYKPDYSYSTSSPFTLTNANDTSSGFLKSGTYLVVIYPNSSVGTRHYSAFMSGVAFRNGNATINYSNMTQIDSLPHN